MEYRPLVVTLISGEDLISNNSSINLKESKKGVYAVATVFDSMGYTYYHKHKTSIHKTTKDDAVVDNQLLTWNSPTTFHIQVAAAGRLTLVIKIKAVRSFFMWDKTLCKVKVPIKSLLNNRKDDGDNMHIDNVFSCQGVLKFSYKFGKKYIKQVYNPRRSTTTVASTSTSSTSGGGFGTGFLTGMVFADIATHHHHGGGGGGCGAASGCGGGGCGGGGCGGGGGGCGGCS